MTRPARTGTPTGLVGLTTLVALGGVLGALARYAASAMLPSAVAATLLVNLLGCLAIGLLVARRPTERLRAFAGTGVLGGLTTMSAGAVQAEALEPARALALLAGTTVGGVLLCRLGLRAGGAR